MELKVMDSIRLLHHAIRNALDAEGHKGPKKSLNHTQMRIVGYLFDHENVCQKDLEEEIHLKKASITGALDSLEDKGLVIRNVCEDDGRKKILTLSDKAYQIRNKIDVVMVQTQDALVKDISQDDLDTFLKVAEKMIDNLEKEGV